MLSPNLASATARRGLRRDEAFTLVEVLVATIFIGLVAGSVVWGLNMLHHRATLNRLYTQAQTICQERIDRVLTAGPYNPSATPAQTPPELMPDQSPTPVPVSTAPGNPVTGTMTTTVTSAGLRYPDDDEGTNLRIKQAKVVVDYNFRGKNYKVEMNTMRAPDQ